MKKIIYSSARNIASAIAKREVSSEEVVTAYLKRIEEVNPKLNAVVQLDPEGALMEARKADAAISHKIVEAPFHGVPITIKDTIETANFISSAGTLGRRSYIPPKDATVVERMRAAGAIILGKTNVPEIAIAEETDNFVYGRTNNPYDVNLSPGGSSGGEGAIIAAGGCAMGLGSDCGGSIREPAHFCGISGIKPTTGRVPMTGHFPPSAGVMKTLWQIGPMARFVEDLILALPVISGIDWSDPDTVDAPMGDPYSVHLKGKRFAYYVDDGEKCATPETVSVIRKVVDVLVQAGCSGEDKHPAGIEIAWDMYFHLCGADGGTNLERTLSRADTQKVHPLLMKKIEVRKNFQLSTTEYFKFREDFDNWRSSMISFFRQYDFIIAPVISSSAPPHGYSNKKGESTAHSYVVPYNLTGWPSAVIRAGSSDNSIPIGVQIIARPWCEHIALAVALEIERNLGGWQRPPL